MKSAIAQSDLLYLSPLRAIGAGFPLYCFSGAGGETGIFEPMVSIMPEGRPVYGVDASRFFDANTSFAIESLAKLCILIIRKKQERGPYYFCGYSLGAVLAYEAASQLADEGEDVRLLALFDIPCPAFVSNLTVAEAARFQKRYLVDRLMKYARNLRAGNFGTFTADALTFLSGKVGSSPWLIARAAFRAVNKPMPSKLRNNAPMFCTAIRAYSPKPYAGPLVLFCRQHGPEHGIDPTLGWGRYALGGIDVFIVPGDHVSMMDRPQSFVGKLIAKLDDSAGGAWKFGAI